MTCPAEYAASVKEDMSRCIMSDSSSEEYLYKKKKSQEYKKNEKRWVEYKINKKIESQVQNKWEKWMMTWVGVYRHVYI